MEKERTSRNKTFKNNNTGFPTCHFSLLPAYPSKTQDHPSKETHSIHSNTVMYTSGDEEGQRVHQPIFWEEKLFFSFR